MTVEVTQSINAPSEDVFRLLTEPEHIPRWFQAFERFEIVSKPESGDIVGTRFRILVRNAKSSPNAIGSSISEFEGVIFQYEPPTSMAFRCGSKTVLVENRLQLTSVSEGQTEVKLIADVRWTHWLARWFSRLLDKAVFMALTQYMTAVRRIAEADAR